MQINNFNNQFQRTNNQPAFGMRFSKDSLDYYLDEIVTEELGFRLEDKHTDALLALEKRDDGLFTHISFSHESNKYIITVVKDAAASAGKACREFAIGKIPFFRSPMNKIIAFLNDAEGLHREISGSAKKIIRP